MSECSDVREDGVYAGKEIPLACMNPPLCKVTHCLWREFHGLRPEQFRKPAAAKQGELWLKKIDGRPEEEDEALLDGERIDEDAPVN